MGLVQEALHTAAFLPLLAQDTHLIGKVTRKFEILEVTNIRLGTNIKMLPKNYSRCLRLLNQFSCFSFLMSYSSELISQESSQYIAFLSAESLISTIHIISGLSSFISVLFLICKQIICQESLASSNFCSNLQVYFPFTIKLYFLLI